MTAQHLDAGWRGEIAVCAQRELTARDANYPGFAPGSTRLKAGSVHTKGGCPLPVDLQFDRDVAVVLRDGVKIYVDVFRPADASGPLPAVVVWSPYGKAQGGLFTLDEFPFHAGVPKGLLSGLQMWEGPDPAWWCERGYAIVHVDVRGAFASEGQLAIWGTQEGRDGYDVVEWIAAQSWSNGRVGFAGNSWLAIAQWFIAAERPPHLAAIAPWEGLVDAYRNNFPGGVVDAGFPKEVFKRFVGLHEREDMAAMVLREPLMSPYWRDKIAQVERIEVPAYVVGSWTNPVHTPGTFEAWQRLGSPQKWLRVHNTMEWPDFYAPASHQELLRFFDRFLKDEANGWEQTPPVRLAVLGAEGDDEPARVVPAFPPPGVAHRALHLDVQQRSLVPNAVSAAAPVRRTGPGDSLCFDLPITQASEVIGYSSLRLWVQLHGSTDQDLHVALERLDARGRMIAARSIPLPNRWIDRLMRAVHRTGWVAPLDMLFPRRVKGLLRVSHRALDAGASTRERPVQSHQVEQPVAADEIVCVDIAIDPVAMRLEPGQTLRLRISGERLMPKALPHMTCDPGRGNGCFSVWSGGTYDSHLWIPLVPAVARRG